MHVLYIILRISEGRRNFWDIFKRLSLKHFWGPSLYFWLEIIFEILIIENETKLYFWLCPIALKLLFREKEDFLRLIFDHIFENIHISVNINISRKTLFFENILKKSLLSIFPYFEEKSFYWEHFHYAQRFDQNW